MHRFTPLHFLTTCLLSISCTLLSAQVQLDAAKELRNQGKYEEALNYCDSIAQLNQDKPLLLANLYDLKGDIYYLDLFSDSLSAVQFFKALAIKEKQELPYEKKIDYTLFRLGLVHYYQAKLDTALHFHRRALKIREPIKDINLMRSYKALGTLFEDKEDFSRAAQYYELALATLLEIDKEDYRQLANLENYRGILFYKQAKYAAAAKAHNIALDYYDKIDQKNKDKLSVHIADCLTNLGNAYTMLKEPEKAIDAQKRAHSLYNKSTEDVDPRIAWNLNNMAVSYRALGQMEEAERALQSSLKAHKKHYKTSRHKAYAAIHDNRGDIAMDTRNYKEAAKQYELAIYNVLPLWQPKTLDEIPTINKETLILGPKSNLLNSLSAKAAAYFLIYQTEGNKSYLSQGLLAYEAADELITLMRQDISAEESKLFWVAKTKSIYEQAIDVCLALNNVTGTPEFLEKAFYFAEKSKSVLLLEKLREDGAIVYSDLPKTVIEKDRSLRSTINKLEGELADTILPEKAKQLQQLRMEHEVFIQQLERNNPQYRRLKNATQSADLPTVQKDLPKGTLLVEYFWGSKAVVVFSFDKKEIYFKTIEKTAQLEENIGEFLDLVSSPLDKTAEVKRYAGLSHQLYQDLLAPVLNEFDTVKRILLVPDGPLGHLPFEALATSKASSMEFEALPFLILDYAFSYSYSASVMMQYRVHESSTSDFLLVAPEQYPNESIPDLKVPENLTNGLKQMYRFKQIKGKQATKQRFIEEISKHKVVHLYTHAVAPENSAPYINLRDSIVTIKELYNLDLAADLVVLSACETNKGDFKKGEGIMSLSRGFSLAGVPSLISSRWKLRKNAAATISLSFYKNLQKGYDKDEALRLAQVEYLKTENASPYYWASFMLVGDYSAVKLVRSSYRWVWIGLGILGILGLVAFFIKIKKNT